MELLSVLVEWEIVSLDYLPDVLPKVVDEINFT